VSVIIPVGARHAQHCRVAAASTAYQSIGADRIETILIADGDAVIGDVPGCTVLESEGVQTGPAHTRNRGIAQARGAFITFLDADDYLQPRGLEHLLRGYASGTHGYTYGNAYTVERDGSYMLRAAPDYVQAHMVSHNIHVITTLIPAHLVRHVGGMDERGDAWEDWRFHLRLAQAGICGYRVDQPVFVYRVYEGSRMTAFYGDRSTMEGVWKDYRNAQGVIPMATCCGGDANMAQIAGLAVSDLAEPNPIAVEGDMVRVKYVGEETGSIPFDLGHGPPIRLGANAKHRYADVTRATAEWLAQRVPIQIVPQIDPPVAPPEALKADDETKAVKPKGRAVSLAVRP
jgi:hypothetical protein